ncbi:MAG: flagellar motor protein [Desulfobacteraceae bacterium 4572_19]|nr:MAG: flagellar motor protein [Desulfobacteraceae bacterium 4572_19]
MAEEDESDGDAVLSPPPPPPEEGGGGAPEWMCTFSDLVTLLMCFFVLMFAMSTIQQETFKEIVKSLRSALGVQSVPEAGTREGLVMKSISSEESKKKDETEAVDELGGLVQKEVEEIVSTVRELIMFNMLGGMVRVHDTEEGAIITLTDESLFDAGSAEMSPRGKGIVKQVSKILIQFNYPVVVAGYTDNIPIHSEKFPSNWELSTSRASAVVRYLIKRGISPNLLSAEGFAQYRPVATNDTAKGRSKNRRVEIRYERENIVESFDGTKG